MDPIPRVARTLIHLQEFNMSIDVYAWSLILWELYTLEPLFAQFDDIEPFVEAVCFDKERPEVPVDCPAALVNHRSCRRIDQSMKTTGADS